MLNETYHRGTQAKTKEQRVLEASGEIKTFPVENLKEILRVDELVRIPNADYPELELYRQHVLHINLPIAYPRLKDSVIALPRIVKNGYFKPPETEELPILSYQNIWRAGVVDFKARVMYNELPDNIFEEPIIGGARNVTELEELVWKRYSPSLPSVSKQAMLDQGLSLTWLYLSELVSLEQ